MIYNTNPRSLLYRKITIMWIKTLVWAMISWMNADEAKLKLRVNPNKNLLKVKIQSNIYGKFLCCKSALISFIICFMIYLPNFREYYSCLYINSLYL